MKRAGKVIGKRALKLLTEDAAHYWWDKTQKQIKSKSESNMLNNSITNNSQLFQYPQQNYTCDKCGGEFQQTTVYSPAQGKQELSKQPTYCPNCIEPTLVVPVPTKQKKVKTKKNTVAYYQCMSACCQQGISPKKITQIAQECKHNSLGILSERTQEIQRLNEAYRQIGESLTNLLQPIQENE